MMLDRLVEKRKYLSEQELLELMALCQILPGPTSTQTITAIGFKRGGPLIAFLTLLIWALPAVVIMTALAILYTQIEDHTMPFNVFQFIQPIAIGFVVYAAYKISRKVLDRPGTWAIAIITLALSLAFASPFLFPFLLILGGVITNFMTQETPEEKLRKGTYRPKLRFLSAFVIVFLISGLLAILFPILPVQLFENFYRFGTLVFGGGQVLVPFMLEQFVNHNHYLTNEQFLTGYGFNQALPGPVFSFASYVGAMCMSEYGTWGEILGGLIGAVGIFLPGTLLIFYLYPFWSSLKGIPLIRKSLLGINAAAAGLIGAAAIQLFMVLESSGLNYAVVLLTVGLLHFTKISAPFIILLGLLGSVIYHLLLG